MKQLIFTFSFLLIAGIGFSQIKVINSGDVGVGGINAPEEALEVDGNVMIQNAQFYKARRSDNNTQEVFGMDANNDITFNRGSIVDDYVSAVIFGIHSSKWYDIRNENNQRIVRVRNGKMVVGVDPTPNAKFNVEGDIFYTGALIPSDNRLKNNVSKFNYGLKELMKLDPISYAYNGKGGTIANSYNVGVMAQDLQKVAPALVSTYDYATEEDEKGNPINEETYLKIYDTGIKYMIINAVKEQQEIIESQDTEIEDLRNQVAELKSLVETVLQNDGAGTQTQVNLTYHDLASMDQNNPNPFDGITNINYIIPTDAKNAKMMFFTLDGQLIQTKMIDHTGEGNMTVTAAEMPSGSYMYKLIVDGREIDTKKMTMVK